MTVALNKLFKGPHSYAAVSCPGSLFRTTGTRQSYRGQRVRSDNHRVSSFPASRITAAMAAYNAASEDDSDMAEEDNASWYGSDEGA